MLSKEDFVAQLDKGASTASELVSALLKHLSRELKKGDPDWWQDTQKAWEKRPFVAWNEAWGLFLTAIHFEAINDANNPLNAFFPSCGGTGEADPSGALAKFLADPPKSFLENLRTGHRRAYIPMRGGLWVKPAGVHFLSRKMPFYLVEIDAGAGFHLAADLLRPMKEFDSSKIAARIGLDPKPLEMADILHRRWVTAGLSPDNLGGIAELDKAADLVKDIQQQDPSFLQLVPCPAGKAPKFIAKNIPSKDTDVGLLVMNMGVTVRMTDPDYQAFAQDVAETLKPWGDRGLWVEVEHVRGELYSSTYQLRAHRFLDGSLRSMVLASIDVEAKKFTDNENGQAFLLPAPAKKSK